MGFRLENRKADFEIIIGCFLLVQKTHGLSSDSKIPNKDSLSLTVGKSYLISKHENGNENGNENEPKLEPKHVSRSDKIDKRNDEDEETEPERNTEHLTPYAKYENQRKKWLKDYKDEAFDEKGYESEYKDIDEKPRYGFQSDAYETANYKDNGGYEYKDIRNEKNLRNNWKPSNQKYPLKSSYGDENKNINYDGKYPEYKNPDLHPVNDKYLKTKDTIEEPRSNIDYESTNKEWQGYPNENKYLNDKHADIHKGKQEYSSNGNYYGKAKTVKDDGIGHKHEYSHLPEGEQKKLYDSDQSPSNLEEDFGKYVKSELFKTHPFSMFHGGHSYGWKYKPNEGLLERYKTELDERVRFLKEHERRLTEMHKVHMESFKKFMSNAFEGPKHKYPNYRMPMVDEIFDKPNHQADSYYNSEPLEYDASSETYPHEDEDKKGVIII
ncbi:uncharacterized protein CEXT_759571 [Caerostris extrusa]|uniref:Uncharacterized protein n=1 Tax=Caerostris extrusa TaxID=172846 RepID=A0AAV4MYK6_CAEEX|nr:uncharacterized protein CEXT_759571 [Caerostris extrusa]